jgi:hypothetical protein
MDYEEDGRDPVEFGDANVNIMYHRGMSVFENTLPSVSNEVALRLPKYKEAGSQAGTSWT